MEEHGIKLGGVVVLAVLRAQVVSWKAASAGVGIACGCLPFT